MKRVKLKELGEIITGTTPNKNIKEYYNKREINFYKPSDIEQNLLTLLVKSEDFISEKAREKVRMLPKGSILVTCIGTIGKIGILNETGACNQQINAIICNEKKYIINILHIYYSTKLIIYKKANSPVVPIINKNDFSNIIIDYNENIEKQQEIANYLDKVQSIIDIRKKQQVKELDELIKSQFVKMFQSGNYFKDELGNLCDVRDGTHDSPKYLEESEYKFITSKNIVNDKIDFTEVKYISQQDYNKFNARSKVNFGDILMPMIGTIGNPIIVNIPNEQIDFAIKNVALIKFYENTRVTNIYIKHLFDSDYFENAIFQNKRGGTQKFIALSDIRKLEIEIPPIELQNEFAEFVKQVDKQKAEIQKSLEEMEKLQESLMNKYFG